MRSFILMNSRWSNILTLFVCFNLNPFRNKLKCMKPAQLAVAEATHSRMIEDKCTQGFEAVGVLAYCLSIIVYGVLINLSLLNID